MHPGNISLILKVASLYYERGLTQDAIAQRLNLSRPKVSRLLAEARRRGIVRTIIVPPSNSDTIELEQQLEDRFQLKEALVVEAVDGVSQELILNRIGATAARYLARILPGIHTLGISWGRSLAVMVEHCSPMAAREIRVVQIVGGLGPPELDSHAGSITKKLADICYGKPVLLPVPGIVSNKKAKETLLEDEQVRAVFKFFHHIDVAFVGIGSLNPQAILLTQGSIICSEDVTILKKNGAVGDVALRFFNRDGKSIQSPIDERVMGIGLDALHAIPTVVGVAGGQEKVEAIKGAMKGQLINVLVTDRWTARTILKEG